MILCQYPPLKIILNLVTKSAVSIATGYELDGCGVRVRVSVEARLFFFTAMLSRLGVGPTHPPIRSVLEALPPR
jgi:hypothetical protein